MTTWLYQQSVRERLERQIVALNRRLGEVDRERVRYRRALEMCAPHVLNDPDRKA